MPAIKRIIEPGTIFGRLTVIREYERIKGQGRRFLCRCSCENKTEKVIACSSLISGASKSCGCFASENRKKTVKKMNEVYVPINFVDNTALHMITATKPQSNSTSGYRGVYWSSFHKKWRAEIKFQKKSHYLGVYKNIEDAIKARKEAEDKYFKEYLRSKEID